MKNEYEIGDRVTFQEPGETEIWHGTVVSVDSPTEITVRFDGETDVEELYTSEVNPEARLETQFCNCETGMSPCIVKGHKKVKR